MEFEWDAEKAEANLKKHKIAFSDAIRIFLDPWKMEEEQADDDDGVRFNVLGIVNERVLHVTYTMRGDVFRIISARPAERHERRYYHEG